MKNKDVVVKGGLQTFELHNVFAVLATEKYLTILNKGDQKEGHVYE